MASAARKLAYDRLAQRVARDPGHRIDVEGALRLKLPPLVLDVLLALVRERRACDDATCDWLDYELTEYGDLHVLFVVRHLEEQAAAAPTEPRPPAPVPAEQPEPEQRKAAPEPQRTAPEPEQLTPDPQPAPEPQSVPTPDPIVKPAPESRPPPTAEMLLRGRKRCLALLEILRERLPGSGGDPGDKHGTLLRDIGKDTGQSFSDRTLYRTLDAIRACKLPRQ
jgi:hypothetical protein